MSKIKNCGIAQPSHDNFVLLKTKKHPNNLDPKLAASSH